MYPTIQSTRAYHKTRDSPIAENASRTGLFLPSSVTLDNEKIDLVCDRIIRFMRG